LEIIKAYDSLADEESRAIFSSVINYKLSGRMKYLLEAYSTTDEIYSLMPTDKIRRIIDAGAYNGDTAREAKSYFPHLKKVVAIEPDKKNFKKLEKNFGDAANVYLHNCAVSNECGEILFAQNGGRNSYISKNGEKTATVSLDSLDFAPPTFINFDVEGQELQAIEGAKNIIKEHKPKMLISAYHKTDDYTQIVKKVLEIRDDYKVYMRHYKYLPAWDTAFYFV
jgi:FkbM family methyltransferase